MQTIINKINNLESQLTTLKLAYIEAHRTSTDSAEELGEEANVKHERRKPGRKKIGSGFDRQEYYRNYQQKLKDVDFQCECGASIKVLSKSLHMLSKKHQRFLRNTLGEE